MATDFDSWETVNHVVFPVRDADETMPLYAVPWTRPHPTNEQFDPHQDFERIGFEAMNRKTFHHLLQETEPTLPGELSDDTAVVGRTAITLAANDHLTFCTYFNAFPASYWRRWTAVRTVRLTMDTAGEGTIDVFRSTGRGIPKPVESIDVSGEHSHIAVELSLDGLLDGGLFWFDAKAGPEGPLTVADAAWSVPEAARRTPQPGTLSIAITTFNRPSYCHDQLKAMAGDAGVRARLDTIYCVDQGTDLVSDQPGFADTAADLGGQLTYLRQPNYGGSGGFSRGMFETVKAAKSAYVLLLDDDAISEPESIVRAVCFADYCTAPTIVGGGMLHLDNRTVLHTQGENLDPNQQRMSSADPRGYNHDFARFPLRDTPDLHKRIDCDYNAWWMCLIPVETIREIGLSLPIFIKFDDIEYGVRAREHGYLTVSLPGVAVWHQAWHDKNSQRTWEEYFIARNRWMCALLHQDRPTLRHAVEMMFMDLNPGLKFFYSAMALNRMALRDLMRGPQYVVETMPHTLADVNRARQGFVDTETKPNFDAFPEPRRRFSIDDNPENGADTLKSGMKTCLRGILARRDGVDAERPDVAVPAQFTVWRAFENVQSALVTSPDGNSVAWCRRDNKLFREQLRRGLVQVRALMSRWEELAAEYRAADMASFETWERIFAQ
ncbi:glycosyltransferase [Bifidobacterium cuniculi]|nr:glycosyltransferase [Bifidobacterium cuniculi]